MIFTELDALAEVIANQKTRWRTVVRTNGCFDIMHPGHVETFMQAKRLGDVVVVWINADQSPYFATKPWRPINDETFRSQIVDSNQYVDYVYLFRDETPLEPITRLQPHILLKWWDYKPEDIVWYHEVTSAGGQVVVVPIVGEYSTTWVIKKILDVYK